MTKQKIGALIVIASAAGFATLAIFIKFAYESGANAITILIVRFLVAAVILRLILKIYGVSPHIGKKTILQLCLLGGIGYGSMAVFFTLSLEYLPASLASMLLYAYPALVTLMSLALGEERFSLKKGFSLIICFIGLKLVLGASCSEVQPIGIMLGLGTAIVYSCYIIVGNRLIKNVDPLIATTYVCASAAVVFVTFGLGSGTIFLSLPLKGWLAMLGIAIFPTIIGTLGFFAGMARIGAANASIISTIEPLITVILAAVLLNESIGLLQALGGILILSGILILQGWPKM